MVIRCVFSVFRICKEGWHLAFLTTFKKNYYDLHL
jgi:hypothetical protein